MGGAKKWAMEQHERGWGYHDSIVCIDCVESPALKKIIASNNCNKKCSYCKSKKTTTTFEILMNAIMEKVHEEYEEPVQHQPYEDGEYVFNSSFLTPDMLFLEVGLECHADLWEDIVKSINNDDWVVKDFFNQNPLSVLNYAWSDFVDLVKYSSRYVFLNHSPSEKDRDFNDYDSINPIKILEIIQNGIIDHQLTSTIKPGGPIFRARFHDANESVLTARHLGTPPPEMAALANRMSPAGIPMFYGAIDKKTAASEAWSKQAKNTILTIGEFTPTRELRMVDLTKIPKNIDYFAYGYRTKHLLYFLNAFLKDFTKPILKDGKEHIEYVPTQVVIEYLRLTNHPQLKEPFDGIIYPSSVTGRKACVIFATNDQCIDSKTQNSINQAMLKLSSHKKYRVIKVKNKLFAKIQKPAKLKYEF